jgi:DNA-binding NarL/FixJ family response regulator
MPTVLALVDDLMFLSRIREAARETPLEVKAVRRPADVVEAARKGARLVLVDADGGRLPWAEALQALREEPSVPPLPVVAFLSHVDHARAGAVREAGCGLVLPRSAFVKQLPRLLAAAAADTLVLEEHAP